MKCKEEEEKRRFEKFFEDLERLIPNPPKGWEKKVQPSKYDNFSSKRSSS